MPIRGGAAAAAVLAVALAACSTSHAPQARLVPATSSANNGKPPAQTVLLADMNGDTSADRVTFRWQHHSAKAPFRGTVLMSVAFVGGRSVQMTVPITGWVDRSDATRPTLPAVAVAPLDGLRREDVVLVVDDRGTAHTSYRVIGYHGDRLEVLPAPGGGGLDWVIGSTSGGGGKTFDCAHRRVIAATGTPSGAHGRQRIVRSTYEWHVDGWHFVSQAVRVGAALTRGWQCAALRSLP